ncbi:hypothetical protein NDU88_005887 [Pleurodeles waltl]|uniref:Uncharacterized protein n=1 Tax=Pleurodeles waltl TaxID=8319 RepID=A0AAV7L3X2_PLEWA|nr:hypothetical protein NDU88_005887 [Pleurodeles waltl]
MRQGKEAEQGERAVKPEKKQMRRSNRGDDTPYDRGLSEECPGSTSPSVALLRHLEKKPEDDAQRVVIKESSTEGEDAVRRSSATLESNAGKDIVGQREEQEQSSAAGDVDIEKEEEVKGSSERLEEENSATCHVPGGTWLEQVRARIRAIRCYWGAINEAAGDLKTGKEKKQKDTKYTIYLTEKQGEYL